MNSCRNCIYAIFHDYQENNPAEYTERVCAAKVMPTIEVAFDDDIRMIDAAANCGSYVHGDSINMDEQELNVASLNQEQRAIWDSIFG